MAVSADPKSERPQAIRFSELSTACACGAPSAVYLFDPFRAYCAEHAPSAEQRRA